PEVQSPRPGLHGGLDPGGPLGGPHLAGATGAPPRRLLHALDRHHLDGGSGRGGDRLRPLARRGPLLSPGQGPVPGRLAEVPAGMSTTAQSPSGHGTSEVVQAQQHMSWPWIIGVGVASMAIFAVATVWSTYILNST